MKRTVEAPEVRNYLAALEARLAHLPADQSDEILFGVREHITEALARGEQSVTEVLTSLGSPDDVLAEPTGAGYPAIAPNSAPALGSAPAPAGLPAPLRSPGHRNSTPWVVLTAALLPFGGFLWGFGWLLGVAGLWMGTRWKVWEKIVGTLLFPVEFWACSTL
ncbi:HAAS signaling domain-containing protein [Arthrobacter sp. Sr24]